MKKQLLKRIDMWKTVLKSRVDVEKSTADQENLNCSGLYSYL